MDEVRNDGVEGEYNEPAIATACARPGPADFGALERVRGDGVVAAGDNSISPAVKLEDSSDATSTLSDAAPTRSAPKTKRPAQANKSAEEEHQDEVDRASFACLKLHGEEVGLHDRKGAEARNQLICAAAATATDPSFCHKRYFKANGLRFDKRTLASPLLGLIRMGLPELHRKLASKWAEGGAEALRAGHDATGLAAILKEGGLEKFVRLAREQKKNVRVARGEAEPAAPSSLGLMVLGAPHTLNGRVTITLNLHDGVADFIGIVEGPAHVGSPPLRKFTDGQPAATGDMARPVIPDEDNPPADTPTSPIQGNVGHSTDGVLGDEPLLGSDAPSDLPPTRTIDGLDGAGRRQMPWGGEVQPPA